jgi:preprotein translocase subunit YajC
VSYLPYLIFAAALILLAMFATRARRRQAQANRRYVEEIAVGTDVMTTAGLYGTVVALNGDGTAQLSIAPGVEVKWALLALRDLDSLPPDFVSEPDADADADADLDAAELDAGRPGGIDLGKRDTPRRADPAA